MSIRTYWRRFLTPNSLRFQLLFRSLLLIAVLLTIIGIFQYVLMRNFIYQNEAASIQNQILSLPPNAWQQIGSSNPGSDEANHHDSDVPEGSNHFPFNGHIRVPFLFMPDTTIAVIDSEGNVVNSPLSVGTPPKLSQQEYRNALQVKRKLTYQVLNQAGGEQLLVLQPMLGRGYPHWLVQVSVSTKYLQQMLIRQLVTFLALALLALIGGMLAFIPVIRKTLVPLSNMVDTVEQIDAGNLAERLPVNQGQVEIDRLAVSFNGMLERLESSFTAEKEAKEKMRRFVADASHELRTPLTSIHGFLEVLLRGAMNQPDQLHKSLRSMYAEAGRMKKLVQDLLLLAKLDRSPNMQLTEGELDSLIKEMEPQLKLLAGNRQVSLQLNVPGRCLYDADKMKQVILNLFHNAVQHTDPDQGQITLSLDKTAGGIEVIVSDNGSGIPEEHLPHLFDRFYRSDSSRTRLYGGAGLGLSITKSIVELHGGSIRVESSVGAGSAFYVWLPVNLSE